MKKKGTCFLVHLVQSMFRKHLLDACVSHTINLTALSPKLLYLKYLSPNCNMYHPKYKISEQNFEYSLFYQPYYQFPFGWYCVLIPVGRKYNMKKDSTNQ